MGMAMKVYFRPEESSPNEEEATANSKCSTTENIREEAEQSPAESTEPEQPPEERFLGGAIIPLDTLFWRGHMSIAQEVRDGGNELPDMLEPWTLQVAQIQVVPAAGWLRPEVQVPLAKESTALAPDANALSESA